MKKFSIGVTVALTASLLFATVTLADDAATANSSTTTTTEAKAEAKEPAPAPTPAPTVTPATPAPGSPLQIKVGDASIRFGLLVQPQMDMSETATGSTANNTMLRRARFLIGGQMTKTVFFFFETENARLGNANAQGQKGWTTGFQTLDAAVEWRANKKFNISGGLLRVPTSRDALESSASEFTIDFNTYAFTATTALMGTGGRDTGMQVRGYFLDDRLEYRAAVVSGYRQVGLKNTFRRVGRVQYNFFDKEVYNFPSYAGNNFGGKKILAVGAAYDQQLDYHGASADVFADIPNRFGSALGTATFQRLDGNNKLNAVLPQSDIFTVDGGMYVKQFKFGPWARYEQRAFDATNKTEKRTLAGINFYPYGNNFNIKVGYGQFKPVTGPQQNQFVVQLQAYYY